MAHPLPTFLPSIASSSTAPPPLLNEKPPSALIASTNKKPPAFNPFSPQPNRSFKDTLIQCNQTFSEEIFSAFSDSDNEEQECFSDSEEQLDPKVPKICFSKAEKKEMRADFKNSLIIKLFKKSIAYPFLLTSIQNQWNAKSHFDLIDLGFGFFTVKFQSRSDYDLVLKEGPWFISGHFLTIRKWKPDFRPDEASLSEVATWIQLPLLPNEYFKPHFLKKIGNQIGTVLRIDQITEQRKRGKFARLCIQINLDEPLLAKIQLGESFQKISYENLGKICASCLIVGHSSSDCKKFPLQSSAADAQLQIPPNEIQNLNTVDLDQTSNQNPWIQVQRKKALPKKTSVKPKSSEPKLPDPKLDQVYRPKKPIPKQVTQSPGLLQLDISNPAQTNPSLPPENISHCSEKTVVDGHSVASFPEKPACIPSHSMPVSSLPLSSPNQTSLQNTLQTSILPPPLSPKNPPSPPPPLQSSNGLQHRLPSPQGTTKIRSPPRASEAQSGSDPKRIPNSPVRILQRLSPDSQIGNQETKNLQPCKEMVDNGVKLIQTGNNENPNSPPRGNPPSNSPIHEGEHQRTILSHDADDSNPGGPGSGICKDLHSKGILRNPHHHQTDPGTPASRARTSIRTAALTQIGDPQTRKNPSRSSRPKSASELLGKHPDRQFLPGQRKGDQNSQSPQPDNSHPRLRSVLSTARGAKEACSNRDDASMGNSGDVVGSRRLESKLPQHNKQGSQ